MNDPPQINWKHAEGLSVLYLLVGCYYLMKKWHEDALKSAAERVCLYGIKTPHAGT